ncbi:hypothetical protein V6N12_028192 [Hibiscus sabdariffa]|uniref:Uncharacterized protein n=1 Tax=Hibiscus sabdariffa TaxID=183260 RepID=A0ABR2F535_9ROSI
MGGPPEYYSCRWSTKSNREAFQIVLGQLHHWLISAADPGFVKTNIMREFPSYLSNLAFQVLRILGLLQSPEDGVSSILDAALAPPDSHTMPNLQKNFGIYLIICLWWRQKPEGAFRKKKNRVVIDFDSPIGIEDYVYRIGRTGASANAVSFTFFSEQDWKYAHDFVQVLERTRADRRVGV